MALLDQMFRTDGLTPHGYCLLWNPGLIYLHVLTDSAIALAYLAIPAALAIIGRRRPDLNPFGILYWFAAFIVLCAATHLLAVLELWLPWYGVSGLVKAVCALVSIITATLVWRSLRFVLAAPSRIELAAANDELRRLNDALEHRVAERTDQLSSANKRLIAAVHESREADRIKADFMARISHELRTPLNAIIGFSEMLASGVGGKLVGKQVDYCDNIRAASELLLQQITDILDLDRMSQGAEVLSLGRQDLTVLCTQVIGRLQPAAHRGSVSMAVQIPRGMTVWSDRGALMAILSNLISNALKYSPSGTTVSIQARSEGGEDLIQVVDHGYGVGVGDLERVFEPFYRAHERELPAVGGSGLGLSLVRMLVDAHGGRLDFRSRLNEGTTVTVWLKAEGSVGSGAAVGRQELPRPGGSTMAPVVN